MQSPKIFRRPLVAMALFSFLFFLSTGFVACNHDLDQQYLVCAMPHPASWATGNPAGAPIDEQKQCRMVEPPTVNPDEEKDIELQLFHLTVTACIELLEMKSASTLANGRCTLSAPVPFWKMVGSTVNIHNLMGGQRKYPGGWDELAGKLKERIHALAPIGARASELRKIIETTGFECTDAAWWEGFSGDCQYTHMDIAFRNGKLIEAETVYWGIGLRSNGKDTVEEIKTRFSSGIF